MYINNWNDQYCTCNRCPCCGKIIRPRLTQTWGTGTPTTQLLNCTTSINDPQNADLKTAIEGLIKNDKLVLS